MTLSEEMHGLLPVDKVDFLVKVVESLIDSKETPEPVETRSVDEKIDSLDLEELAQMHGITKKGLIRIVKKHGGKPYRFGKNGKTMIRKTQWLAVVRKMEEETG